MASAASGSARLGYVPDAGNDGTRQARHFLGHARESILAQHIRLGATDGEERNPPKRSEQRPQIDILMAVLAAKRLDQIGVPVRVKTPIFTLAERGTRQAHPRVLSGGGEVGQGGFHVARRRLPIVQDGNTADIGDDALEACARDLGPDVVDHSAGQGARHGGGHDHGDHAAERRADNHHLVNVGGGQEMTHVFGIGARLIMPPVGIVGGAPAAPVIGAQHPALRRNSRGDMMKIFGIARQAAQAENRRHARQRIAVIPEIEAKTVLGSEGKFPVTGSGGVGRPSLTGRAESEAPPRW